MQQFLTEKVTSIKAVPAYPYTSLFKKTGILDYWFSIFSFYVFKDSQNLPLLKAHRERYWWEFSLLSPTSQSIFTSENFISSLFRISFEYS